MSNVVFVFVFLSDWWMRLGLHEEQMRDIKILEEEFDEERE